MNRTLPWLAKCVNHFLTTFAGCTAEEANYITLDNDAYNMSESEYKDACKKIKYKNFRYETKYMEEHKKIKCKGEVLQICNEEDSTSNYYSAYRVAITMLREQFQRWLLCTWT